MSRTVKAETSKTPIEDLHHSWYLKILSCCIRLSYILLQQKPFYGYLFPFWNINVNISRIYSFCWRLTHIYVEFYNNVKLEKVILKSAIFCYWNTNSCPTTYRPSFKPQWRQTSFAFSSSFDLFLGKHILQPPIK